MPTARTTSSWPTRSSTPSTSPSRTRCTIRGRFAPSRPASTSGFSADHRGLEAVGATGSVLATDPWQSQPAAILLRGEEIRFDEANPYQLELEDVHAAIRGERPPLLGREDALGQARTLAALRRSAEEGRPVRP